MNHLDEATIVTVRDGGPVSRDVRAHLDACATCTAALAAALEREELIERMLTALDRPVEPTAAKAGVRARLRPAGAADAPSRWGGWHLGRAAALLLVTAGAAAALSGSPLRSLWSTVPEPAPAEIEEPTISEVPVATSTPGSEGSGVGIAVAMPDGLVHVVVRGAQPGTEVVVTWADRASARVTAPPGSRFTYSEGRVEVDASLGSIRIELPRDAGEVTLEVDGDVYLRGSPVAAQVSGPAVERSDDSIRFRVGGR